MSTTADCYTSLVRTTVLLADLTGLATGYLSQLLNGKRYPSAATRRRLQDALGVGFDDLFIMEECDGE